MYRISKSFMFSAAHKLLGLPPEHPCTRLHGHDYQVTVFLQDEKLDKRGFVKDYRELDEFKEWLNDKFDHRYLNDRLPAGMNPTAENIAKYIFEVWNEGPDGLGLSLPLWGVEVKETPKTSALYYE